MMYQLYKKPTKNKQYVNSTQKNKMKKITSIKMKTFNTIKGRLILNLLLRI